MILNIWESIGNFFKKLYLELSWTSIFVLLTGIIIGFIIFAAFYLVLILRGVKQAEKTLDVYNATLGETTFVYQVEAEKTDVEDSSLRLI